MTRLIAALAVLVGLNVAAAAQEKAHGINVYYVEVTSACEKRQRCIINAYVVGSRGGKTGQGTLVLGKASPGQEARKTWTMRTAENGGMASMSWSCKDI
jgi:hypothetical protein